MKRIATAAALGLGLTIGAPAFSDTIFGIYVGGGTIDYDYSGDFTDLEDGGDPVSLENDLGLSGDSGNYFYVAIEHPIPLLPNIKVAHSDISESAANTLDKDITFGGQTFPEGTYLRTDVDFTHTDFTFYYEVLDNWISLDLGLTARKFDGEIVSQGSYLIFNETAEEKLDFTAPLLYGMARFDLPITGLYVQADGNWIGAGGAQLFDVWGKVGYTFAFGLGLEAGLRKLALELDDVDDLDADITLDGTYFAATFHF